MNAVKQTCLIAIVFFFAYPAAGFWDHGDEIQINTGGGSKQITDYAGTSLMKALHLKYAYPTVGGLDFFAAVILEDEYNAKSIELHYCKVDQYPIRESLVNTGKDWFKVFAIDLPPDTVDVYAPSIDCFSVEQDMNRIYTIVVMSFVYEDSSGTFCRVKTFKFQPDGAGSLDMVTPASLEDQTMPLSGSYEVTKSITSYFHYKDAGQKTVFVGLESWGETPVNDICHIKVYAIDINQTTINNLDDTYTIEYEYDSDFELIYEASFPDLGGFVTPRKAFLDFECFASTLASDPEYRIENIVVSHNYQFADFKHCLLSKLTREKTSNGWSQWEVSGDQIQYGLPNFTGEVYIEKNNQLIREGSISVFVSSREPGSGEKKILTAVVTLPSWNANSVLKEITTIPENSQWDIKADRGLIGLQSTSYNKGSLAYCDWANHRADWISEPPQIMESTPTPMPQPFWGYWVAEKPPEYPPDLSREYKYPEDKISTGELTRVYWENEADLPAHFSIRRQFHFVYNNANNDLDNQMLGYKIFSRRGEILKEQLFNPRPSGGGNILGLKLIADSFSSIHVLYEVIETLPRTGLYWNSIKVLKNTSGSGTNAFDVMDHPYDVSMVPQGDGTPVPDVQEFWVADMHGNRLIRVNQNQELLASTVVVEPQAEYTYSPLELCDVIAPSDVSACRDGSCWAIDWGRRSVVKVLSDGTLADRTECGLPYPKEIRDNMVQWPSAIDCAGDPNTCFVTDYEGGKVWKLTWNGTVLMTPTPSLVSYREPYAIAVQSGDVGGNPVDYVWVSGKYRMTPPPVGTATPIPSSTPTPTPTPTPPVGTTYTPHPSTPTPSPIPYPEHHRVTRNRFGSEFWYPEHSLAIPVNLSSASDPNLNKCIISDRNSYRSSENRIRISSEGFLSEYPNEAIQTPQGPILRPSDVEYVE